MEALHSMENKDRIEIDKENRRLKAEITLLKSSITKLEKENHSLKVEKAKYILNKAEIEEELRKKLILKEKENKIMENNRKAFKPNPQESIYEISTKFVLESTLNSTNIQMNSFLKNLQFFKNFFFDDFFSITDEKADEIVEYYQKQSQKEFIEAFEIFSCKKYIFTKFSLLIFDDNSFINQKIKILQDMEPEWIVEMLENGLKRFIDRNKTILIVLFANFAQKCPFHLKSVMDKETFNGFLPQILHHPTVYKLLYFIVKHKIASFIDYTNLHLIPKNFVLEFFEIDEKDYVGVNI